MYIAGVDEAGRGPLVGPVVAAAVILPAKHEIIGLTDSKKLTAKKREILYNEICAAAISYKIVQISAQIIDEINILQASLLAMQQAVLGLAVQPTRVIVDGNKTPDLPMPVQAIVKGDLTEESISAASILAKVNRDNYMLELDKRFPEYRFIQHKGYPTKQHLSLLQDLPIIAEYRKTFRPVRELLA